MKDIRNMDLTNAIRLMDESIKNQEKNTSDEYSVPQDTPTNR